MLTIGQLADRTGLQPGTLRAWEQRHGFPRAERLPSGHRRYPEGEVERVRQVEASRGAGLSMKAAIERLATGPDPEPAPSIFAGLRRHRPDLPPYPVPKRLLVAISHALEDECSARGGGALLIGSFQRERFYRQAEPRWRSFAQTAELAIALADFPRPRTPRGGPAEVPVDRSHPLSKEWAIVCHGPGVSACLAGWERPEAGRGGERLFEMLWSVEPELVREAARIGARITVAAHPALERRLPRSLDDPVSTDAGAVERATALTNRMLAYITAAS